MSADEFIAAASVPTDGSSHAGGTLDAANRMLAASPELARASIYTAAVLGDDEAVRRFIAADASTATAKSGPRGWDALTCLCFSRYLRLDRSRSDAFVRAATALLDAGANPNTGWFDTTHRPNPEWESAIYGAAGVNARDARGRSPLMLAVKACVDSYWTEGRAPDSVAALLAAGAATDGIGPSGYQEVDELIAGAT